MKIGLLLSLAKVVKNWPRVAFDHLGLCTRPYRCHLRNGLSLEIRGGTDDRHVVFEVFAKRVYRRLPSEGDNVIDIGAHIGAFTLAAAHANARVYAYEAFPENAKILRRNVRRNGLRNVEVFNLAVADGSGTRQLYLPDCDTRTGRYSLNPGRGLRTCPVSCVSLADILADNRLERVDLLKIDCEGGEYDIVFGAGDPVIAKIHAIVAECHDSPNVDDNYSPTGLKAFLEQRGFEATLEKRMLLATRGHRSH